MIVVIILMVVFACVLIWVGCPYHDEDGVCYFSECDFNVVNETFTLKENCTEFTSWLQHPILDPHDNDEIYVDFMMQLNAAVYIVAQALYTVGYGDIPTSNSDAERIFTTIMMLSGSFSYAYTIAVMASVIANNDML